MRVRKSHDLIHWVRFFLSGEAETATKGRDTFQKILALRTEVEQQVLSLGKRAPTERQALNMLYRKLVMSAADLEQGIGISTPTTHALIRDLMRLGILNEVSG